MYCFTHQIDRFKIHIAKVMQKLTRPPCDPYLFWHCRYAELIYNGFWFSPEREALQAAIDVSQKYVSGTVRLKLYKVSLCMPLLVAHHTFTPPLTHPPMHSSDPPTTTPPTHLLIHPLTHSLIHSCHREAAVKLDAAAWHGRLCCCLLSAASIHFIFRA